MRDEPTPHGAPRRPLERIQHDVRRTIQAIKDGFGDADPKVE